MTLDRDRQIASTIIEQIGGSRNLGMMIAAKLFVAIENGVMFSFKGSKRYNKIRIVLNGNDLYDVEFFWVARGYSALRFACDDVCCDSLKAVIERTTGLRLSLFGSAR